ncbi:MAG: GtrA family protein [Synechococcaceae cyanobacterium]|nr:GtrA family protein [Synechococcaceae cyanobacterium]
MSGNPRRRGRRVLASLRQRRLHRFLLVGLLNTVNGYVCILVIQALSGDPLLSNLLGYLLSAAFSYFTHSRLTFGHRPSSRSAVAYSLVLLGSYGVNLAVLRLTLPWLGATLAQGVAVLSFAAVSYVGQSTLVFPQRQTPGSPPAGGRS